MTPEQFAYWLQGYAEVAGEAPTPEQWQVIRDHLALVFEKRTPNRASDPGRWLDGGNNPHWELQPRVYCSAMTPKDRETICGDVERVVGALSGEVRQ